jgi:hypothetical protein
MTERLTCSLCDRPRKARGYCNTHLGRLYRGAPLDGSRQPRKVHALCSGGCGTARFRGSPDFYVHKGVPRTKCKTCLAQESESWRQANPERHKAIFRRCNHRINLRLRFGLTVEEFDALFRNHNGLCDNLR